MDLSTPPGNIGRSVVGERIDWRLSPEIVNLARTCRPSV